MQIKSFISKLIAKFSGFQENKPPFIKLCMKSPAFQSKTNTFLNNAQNTRPFLMNSPTAPLNTQNFLLRSFSKLAGNVLLAIVVINFSWS